MTFTVKTQVGGLFCISTPVGVNCLVVDILFHTTQWEKKNHCWIHLCLFEQRETQLCSDKAKQKMLTKC